MDRQAPDGTERLFTEGISWAHPDMCENYGKDLVTGAADDEAAYRSLNPDGKAMIKGVGYVPAHERPDEQYPFHLTTGRTRYHFHTRTKTGRAPQLNNAAPEVWVEISETDAVAQQLAEGDLVEVRSPRGTLQGKLRVTGIRPGLLFAPFQYGYWDTASGSGPSAHTPGRAANETTITDWDPASKQPLFKTAAAALILVEKGNGEQAPAPTTTASAPIDNPGVRPTVGGREAVASQTLHSAWNTPGDER
ncbi:anaerobic selenocysteine-containing dehydrogenase [Streptomyces sp. HB132]|nr:anaerobic selenocysteine-containing dehydrogenase [Streptomyces sp. HB132]